MSKEESEKNKLKAEIELIKEKFSKEDMFKFIESSSNSIKQYSGMLIAAAFSMVIFLLSLITNRTLVMDLGIFFLVLSIFFFISCFGQADVLNYYFKISPKKAIIQLSIWNILGKLGNNFFFLGFILLLKHFQLIIIVLITIILFLLWEFRGFYFETIRLFRARKDEKLKKFFSKYLKLFYLFNASNFGFNVFFSIIILLVN